MELFMDFQIFSRYRLKWVNFWVLLTYLPHEAVAEVSKDKEPIGRGDVEFI